MTLGKDIIRRVFFVGSQQRHYLPSVFCWLSAKSKLFFLLLPSKIFLTSTYSTWYSMLKFDIFLGLFAIFN